MIRLFPRAARLALALPLLAAALIAGCGGNEDDAPANAPANVQVEAADTGVIVRWDSEPGLTYWVFVAEGTGLTRDNFQNFAGGRIIQPATSPQVVAGLVNGRTYSVFVNSTRDGGPAGPASPTLTAVPRLAGAEWTAGAPLAADLNAGIFGLGGYILVGAGGAIFTSADSGAASGSFSAVTSGVNANLNGVTLAGTAVAVGDGGTIITSVNGSTWTTQNSGSTARLNDVAVALGAYIAVGDGGSILRSTDATTWTAVASGTTANLHGVTLLGSIFAAFGANGTLLTSSDAGLSWVARTSNTSATLRSAATNGTTSVVVGDGGAWLTSDDAITWTVQTPFTAQNLNRVLFGSQYVAVGDGGAVFTSTGDAAWTAATSNTTSDLRGLLRGPLLNYLAVGSGGANIGSR